MRHQDFFKINSLLSYFSTHELSEKINAVEVTNGWGKNAVIEINGTKIFTKSIPITKLEFENQFSTKNLYNLPMCYNYGVGSAGFNCWRELLINIKATNWVLNNTIKNFPLLYHYRINKRDKQKTKYRTTENLEKYIEYWNGNLQIKEYILARENADYELILFLEYIPFNLRNWLDDSKDKIDLYLQDSSIITNHLFKEKIIHLDTHESNYLTDGKMLYLADFGLAVDSNFDLDDEEKRFFSENYLYDFSLSILQLVNFLFEKITHEDHIEYFQNKYSYDDKTEREKLISIIYNNIQEIIDHFNMSKEYFSTLKKFENIIQLHYIFLNKLKKNSKKDNAFPQEDFKNLFPILRQEILGPV